MTGPAVWGTLASMCWRFGAKRWFLQVFVKPEVHSGFGRLCAYEALQGVPSGAPGPEFAGYAGAEEHAAIRSNG